MVSGASTSPKQTILLCLEADIFSIMEVADSPLALSTIYQPLKMTEYIAEMHKKEYLQFEVSTESLPYETQHLVNHIKEVAETVLYHWKTFPIILPSPSAVQPDYSASGHSLRKGEHADNRSSGGDSSGYQSSSLGAENVKPLILKDVLVTPSFDELDAVAINAYGDPKSLSQSHLQTIQEKGLHQDTQGRRRRLTSCQLETLRQTGQFEVESLHFPGQTHRWQVSEWLQLGCDNAHERFLDDIALAASFLVIIGRNRLFGNVFSLRSALQSLWKGIWMLIDLFFGKPWLQAHNLESRMKEERCSYLVQELTCKDRDVEELCLWMVEQIKRASREKFQLTGEKQPPVPYIFCTPQGLELDLRLFNKEVMRKALPHLSRILERESRGWFLHFREKTISQLKARHMSDADVEKEANRLVMEEYLNRVFSSILAHPDIRDLGEGIPELLVAQAKSVLFMHRALDDIEKIYEEGERARKVELEHTYPILSRIESWLKDDLAQTHSSLVELHRWRPHDHALALCKSNDLKQQAYFLQRDLTFMREREPVLKKELKNLKVPVHTFYWRSQIWFPHNYLVTRSFQGENELIPTVMAASPTSITTPRTDPNQPVYLLEKQLVRHSSTRWPIWRWLNFFHRLWAWTCNSVFFFGVWVPLCSPVSLRALMNKEPFMSDFELSQVNGTLCPSKSSVCHTLYSRLTNLWRHISKARTNFETTPDTGFIGKGITRHMNRMWNYVLKGIFGTVFLTTVFPLACVFLSLGSLAIALIAPIWVPALVVLTHLMCIFLYDIDLPNSDIPWLPFFRALFWHIILLGFIQPFVALFAAVFVCPFIAAAISAFSVVRRGIRYVWDAAMFHCIIKKRGRVPAADSVLVKRVAGPGLQCSFFYQINCEQALAVFDAYLEMEELAAFQRNIVQVISKPLLTYSGLVSRDGAYGLVEKEVQDLTESLQDKIDRRRRELSLGLSSAVRSKVKLVTRELKMSLKLATIMLEEFYPSHIFCRIIKSVAAHDRDSGNLSSLTELEDAFAGNEIEVIHGEKKTATESAFESEEAWWDYKGLSIGDYASLASLIFSEIFSPEFLTPMDEGDTCFQMEVAQGVNLTKYADLVRNIPNRPDLDDKLTVHAPRGNIKVKSPYLDILSFLPLIRYGAPTQKSGRMSLMAKLSRSLTATKYCDEDAKTSEKLLIPPPVPHPAHIAVIIHNRESADSIPLDARLTLQVLRLIEDSVQVITRDHGTEETNTPATLSRDSSPSHTAPSIYNDLAAYVRTFSLRNSISSTQDSKNDQMTVSRASTLDASVGRTAPDVLENSKTLTNRSATVELSSPNIAQRLANPLRALLEGQRPFSVSLNLAAAEEGSTEDEEESRTEGHHIPLQSLGHSSGTAV